MSKNGKGCSGNTHTQSQMNHHANQCNPNNSAHTAAMNNPVSYTHLTLPTTERV